MSEKEATIMAMMERLDQRRDRRRMDWEKSHDRTGDPATVPPGLGTFLPFSVWVEGKKKQGHQPQELCLES